MYKGVAGEKEIGETCFNASKGLIWGMSNMRGCCREKKKKRNSLKKTMEYVEIILYPML